MLQRSVVCCAAHSLRCGVGYRGALVLRRGVGYRGALPLRCGVGGRAVLMYRAVQFAGQRFCYGAA